MIKRLIFTIKHSFIARNKIRSIQYEDKYQIREVTELDLDKLKKNGIEYLVFDFDGVLASHGDLIPKPIIFKWFKNVLFKNYNENNIFIFSNKPNYKRISFFTKFFPKIRFIQGVSKKPYPEGLIKITNMLHCKAHSIAVIDDRILTGILASILAGCFPILITQPYKNYFHHPIQELFFGSLRYLEKIIFFRS